MEKIHSGKLAEVREPRTKIKASFKDIACLRLAGAGYCNGDPDRIAKSGVVWVLKMLNYERFLSDYEQSTRALNE